MIADKQELGKYLKNNPWPLRFSQEHQVEYLFTFSCDLSPEQLWPHLSDTSSLNRKLGMKPVMFTERAGRLYGSGRISGFMHEWEEVPWQWEYPAEIKMSREYSAGIMSHMRGHLVITRTPENTSQITMYYGLVPSGAKGRLILIAARKPLEKKLKKIFAGLRDAGSGKEYSYLNPQISENGSKKRAGNRQNINRELLDRFKKEITGGGAPAPVTEALASFITRADDDSLYRMKPAEIAAGMGVNTGQLVSVMLHSCRSGLLEMSWDVVCPHCRQVRKRHRSLSDIGGKTVCGPCGIEFDSTSLNSIEITFGLNPDVRRVTTLQYCSAEPAKKQHIFLQKHLSPGNKYLYTLPLLETRLKFREHGRKSYGLLDIKQGSSSKALYWDDISSSRIIETAPGSTVFITNTDNYDKRFIISESAADRTALRPSELFVMQEFRDMFGDAAVSHGNSIDIGTQNIMVTEITGLPGYCSENGDRETFSMAKKYFGITGGTAAAHSGALVSTTGSSALLAFGQPMDALKAGIKLLKTFSGTDDTPLMVRISIHRGECIAVNLDSPIDYYGQAVNIASGLKQFADAGEMVLSESFASERTVERYLNEKGYAKNFTPAQIEGTGGTGYLKIRVRR